MRGMQTFRRDRTTQVLYILVMFLLFYCLSVQRLENLKTSIVFPGALNKETNKYICDTIPLDKPK